MRNIFFIAFFQLLTIQILFSSEPEVLWDYEINVPTAINFQGNNYTKLGNDCVVSAFELYDRIKDQGIIALHCLNLDGTKRWEKMITYSDSIFTRIFVRELEIIDNDIILLSIATYTSATPNRTLDLYSLTDGSLISRNEYDTSLFEMNYRYRLVRVDGRNFAFGRTNESDTLNYLIEFDDAFNLLNITPVDTRNLDFVVWSTVLHLYYSNNSFTSFSIYGNPTIGNTVLNFDISGNINWALQLNPPNTDSSSIYLFSPNLDNGFLVGGDAYKNGMKYFLHGRITPYGELTWAEPIQIDYRKFVVGIKALNDGNIAYFGTYIAPINQDGQYISNAFINIIDKNGVEINNFNWRYYPNSSYAVKVEEMPNGNLIVSGTQTWQNLFVSMIKPVVSSIAESEISGSAFSIHPNPATDYIYINFGDVSVFGDVKIYNTLGECVIHLASTLSEGEGARIDVSHLPPGVYFVRVGNNAEKFVKR